MQNKKKHVAGIYFSGATLLVMAVFVLFEKSPVWGWVGPNVSLPTTDPVTNITPTTPTTATDSSSTETTVVPPTTAPTYLIINDTKVPTSETATAPATNTTSLTENTNTTTTPTANATTKTTKSVSTSVAEKPTANWVNVAQQKIAILTKIAKLGIDAPGATKVSLYVSRSGSVPYYLGAASKEAGDRWTLLVDTQQQLPNGTYILYALITNNTGGQYKSDEVQLFVNVGVDNPETTKQVTSQTAQIGSGTNSQNQNLEVDSDNDGLTDAEESRLGTNLRVADTDGDGFLDGDEVKKGFDPLKYSPGDGRDKIAFESPKQSGEVKKEIYRVEKVEISGVGGNESRKLKFSGKALPNTFVTVYIFSDPVVVLVKTDKDGNWVYELDKDLEEGNHQVYVAVTDNTGKITAKSEPLSFVKTAEAATIVPDAQAQNAEALKSPIEKSSRNFLPLALLVVIIFLCVAMVMIGFLTYKHHSDERLL